MRRSFVTALGEKQISRNLLIIVRLDNGLSGLGEASASLAWPLDTQKAMAAELRKIIPHLIGCDIKSYANLTRQVWNVAGKHPAAAAALECALLDVFAKNRGISLWKLFGGKKRFVTTGFTISAWPPKKAARVARQLFADGFRTFKIKVTGADMDEDMNRVFSVHKAAGRAQLIVDANQGFQPRQAIRFAECLRRGRLPVQLLEQPVAKENWEGLKEVEREGKIPVAADESARSVEDARRLIEKKIVSVINIKLAKSGISGALKIIRLAKFKKIQLMIGCMAESAVGLGPSVHLACGTGAFQFVDLDSHLLVRPPKGTPNFMTRGPRLFIRP